MRMSNLFTKTSKSFPKDEQSVSAQLLIKAGYIDKVSAGVYTLLPLGYKVASKIIAVIRNEMESIGGQEIYMPGLVPKENWEKTGRWSDLDVLFKLKGRDEKEYGLGASHEEIISPLAKKFTLSYKDLPFAVFQIQNKFRNELRAKSGVLRTREFLMKDLYSFHADEADLNEFYDKATRSYWNIFENLGIKNKTHFVYASGGTFAKYSHEFQTETEAGEDEIYICKSCQMGINKEILPSKGGGEFSAKGGPGSLWKCPECGKNEYELKKAIEIGNIFKLKTKYSEPFDLRFVNKNGESKPVLMGCYGIGIQRLMGAVAEIHHDEKGLIWPRSIAPFGVYLIRIKNEELRIKVFADEMYSKLQKAGVEVLYDDRDDVSTGEKFADADLLGMPYRVVVSEKTGDKVELKKRDSDRIELIDISEAISKIG